MSPSGQGLSAILVALAALGVLGIWGGPALAQEERPTGLSASEFESLRQECDLRSQLWARIPWKASVTEARELAARTGKPIFMVVTTGSCLGYT